MDYINVNSHYLSNETNPRFVAITIVLSNSQIVESYNSIHFFWILRKSFSLIKNFKKLPGEARNVPQVSHKTKNLREHFNDL